MENPSMPMTLLAAIAQSTIDLIMRFEFLNYLLSLMNAVQIRIHFVTVCGAEGMKRDDCI